MVCILKVLKKTFILVIAIINSNFIIAQTCCSGGVPLSNNIGLPILEKGTIQLGLSYDYNNLNTLKEGTSTIDDTARLRITHSALLNFGYAITNRLSVETLFTWVNQRRQISQFGNVNLDQANGIGDAIILGSYQFLEKPNYSFSSSFGFKLPTGSTNEKNKQGIILNADLQPGSNALDLIFTSSYIQKISFRKSMSLNSKVTYRATGKNNNYLGSNTYKFGNEFQLLLTLSDHFSIKDQIISLASRVKYRYVVKDNLNGNLISNTGGNWVFIEPRISLYITPNIIFSTRLEVPLHSNVDGTQLTPTYRINSGIAIKFNQKGKNNLL
ncbi:MAG: hypothetical protein ACJA1D_000339 [Polaribacter sp.]|jgi:hypothetical protein